MNIAESRNVSSLNWTVNASIHLKQEIVYEISTASQITNAVITIFTVALNCAMIRCLQTNRSKIPEVIFHQLMCLSVSDVFAGLTPVISALSLIESVNRSTKACIAILVPFAIAQYAVLLNLCALSFRRWLVLRKASKPTTRTGDQNLLWTIIYTLGSWLLSFLCNIIASIIATTKEPSVNGCLSPDLIENPMAMKIVTAAYFGTLLLLNVFSGVSAMTLKRLNATNTTGTNNRRREVQQRAFRHLLAVLMVANVTTLPLIIISVTTVFRKHEGPATIYKVTYFQALNSLINPILYSAHINEIRDAIKAKFVSFLGRNRNGPTRYEINNLSGDVTAM